MHYKSSVYLFLLIVCTTAFATAPTAPADGTYSITGADNDNIQLLCTCGNTSFVTAAQKSSSGGGDQFSIAAIGQAMLKAGADKVCPKSNGGIPKWDPVFFNLSNCVFESTDSKPIQYAKVSISDMGDHCMKANGSCTNTSDGYALAANFNVQPISQYADYMVSNNYQTGTNPDTNLPYSTTYACDGKVCAQAWTGQLYKTLSGSITINNAPQDLQFHCTKPTELNITKVQDDPQGVTIAFQQTHDAQTTDAQTDVTADCSLTSQGNNYGTLTLQGINGIRSQGSYPAHMWSAKIAVKTQPDTSTNTTLDTPQATHDDKQHFGCSSDGYCNNWTVNLVQARYPGNLTITGAPSALTVTGCTKGISAKAHQVADDPSQTVIDFEKNVYDQVTSTPDQVISPTCELQGNDGQSYGKITFDSLSDTYTSTAHTQSHLWAANVKLADQPDPKTNFKLSDPIVAKDSDSDSTGQFHNLWTAALSTRAYLGSITITGGPSTLVANCSQGLAWHIMQHHLQDDQGLQIDFQQTHDQFAPNDPSKTFSPVCALKDSNSGVSYGAVTLTDLNGARTSAQHSDSQLWSAKVTASAQPDPTTNTKLNPTVVAQGSDSDTSGQYHNLWTTTISTAAEQGTINIINAPETLDISCKSMPIINSTSLDLKTLHDAQATDPATLVTTTCGIQGHTDKAPLGIITVTSLKGSYVSKNKPDESLWAAVVTVTQQPQSYQLEATVASGSDSDPTGDVHNLWNLTFK